MDSESDDSHNKTEGTTCHSNRRPLRTWWIGRTRERRDIISHAPLREMPTIAAISLVVGDAPAASFHATMATRSVVTRLSVSGMLNL